MSEEEREAAEDFYNDPENRLPDDWTYEDEVDSARRYWIGHVRFPEIWQHVLDSDLVPNGDTA